MTATDPGYDPVLEANEEIFEELLAYGYIQEHWAEFNLSGCDFLSYIISELGRNILDNI